jgi:hypothetical protein
MSTTLPAQDTTPVAVPDISASALADLVAELQGLYQGDPRVERAVGVLFSGRLYPTAELGSYLVTCPNGGPYHVRGFSCTCPDSAHRGLMCKHQIAVQLLHSASAAARRERLEREYAPVPFSLTAKALAELDAEPVGVA